MGERFGGGKGRARRRERGRRDRRMGRVGMWRVWRRKGEWEHFRHTLTTSQ